MGTAVFHSAAHREGTIEGKRGEEMSRRIHGRVSLFLRVRILNDSHEGSTIGRNQRALCCLARLFVARPTWTRWQTRIASYPREQLFFLRHTPVSEHRLFDLRPPPLHPPQFSFPLQHDSLLPLFIVPLSTIAMQPRKKGVERFLLKIATIIFGRPD